MPAIQHSYLWMTESIERLKRPICGCFSRLGELSWIAVVTDSGYGRWMKSIES